MYVCSWKYGRTDCDSADAPNTIDEAAYNIPESKFSADEQVFTNSYICYQDYRPS